MAQQQERCGDGMVMVGGGVSPVLTITPRKLHFRVLPPFLRHFHQDRRHVMPRQQAGLMCEKLKVTAMYTETNSMAAARLCAVDGSAKFLSFSTTVRSSVKSQNNDQVHQGNRTSSIFQAGM
jgi:hypothetical protein